MKKVVVLIPIYKETLNEYEKASFKNNVRVLREYDLVAIHPIGLDIGFYKKLCENIIFKAFPVKFFDGIRGYNRMLIAPWFYRAFLDYKFLLICHYDAWIFKDSLSSWCDLDYDNIAAPFLKPFPLGKTSSIFPKLAGICVNKVGNGGLSLRKTQRFYDISKKIRLLSLFYFYNEDVFWAIIPKLFFKFNTPSIEIANRFSARMLYPTGILDEKGELPFGCHGWFRKDEIEFWQKYILGVSYENSCK